MSSGFHIALLRGINVGGKNRLPMKDLAKMFSEAGCADVLTYIQSGNVVFRAKDAVARRVPALVATAITKRFQFQAPVQTRTAKELEEIVAGNPFLRKGTAPDLLHVAFLANAPTPLQAASLDPNRSPPDELVVRGREIFLRLPNGVARSKLTNAYFDSKLGTVSTLRNWRTVLQLLELARAGAPVA